MWDISGEKIKLSEDTEIKKIIRYDPPRKLIVETNDKWELEYLPALSVVEVIGTELRYYKVNLGNKYFSFFTKDMFITKPTYEYDRELLNKILTLSKVIEDKKEELDKLMDKLKIARL